MEMHPSTEKKTSTDWKIFHAAGERLSAAYDRIIKIKSLKTFEDYDKFIDDEKRIPKSDYDQAFQTDDINLGLNNLFSENDKIDVVDKEEPAENQPKPTYQRQNNILEDSEDSDSSSNDQDDKRSSCSAYSLSSSTSDSCSKNENEGSSESRGDSSEDQNLDDFLKEVSSKDEIRDGNNDDKPKPAKEHFKCQPYTSLKDCLMKDFLSQDNLTEIAYRTNEEATRATNYLDENLPLIQVLDVLHDIDKVLKVGQLTPQMERIMEYKQEHPFTYGYQEEELGCFPWLCFKIEQLLNKFWLTQWPN